MATNSLENTSERQHSDTITTPTTPPIGDESNSNGSNNGKIQMEMTNAASASSTDKTVIVLSKQITKHEISRQYNKTLRNTGIFVTIGIILGFLSPYTRFLERGKWFSNAMLAEVAHPPETQILLSIHAFCTFFWVILGVIQIIFGSLLITKDKEWIGAKYHRFVGKYILFPILVTFVTAALIVLFEESAKNRMNVANIILNVVACLFVIIWSILGVVFIYYKQYLRHKDCMISVFIITFIPGIFRLIRFSYLLIYYAINQHFCVDANPMLYTILTSIITLITIMYTLKIRLNRSQPHNLLFTIAFCVACLFPIITMEFNLNPCASVNLPDTKFGIVIG